MIWKSFSNSLVVQAYESYMQGGEWISHYCGSAPILPLTLGRCLLDQLDKEAKVTITNTINKRIIDCASSGDTQISYT